METEIHIANQLKSILDRNISLISWNLTLEYSSKKLSNLYKANI